jgi:hypothetical protein
MRSPRSSPWPPLPVAVCFYRQCCSPTMERVPRSLLAGERNRGDALGASVTYGHRFHRKISPSTPHGRRRREREGEREASGSDEVQSCESAARGGERETCATSSVGAMTSSSMLLAPLHLDLAARGPDPARWRRICCLWSSAAPEPRSATAVG